MSMFYLSGEKETSWTISLEERAGISLEGVAQGEEEVMPRVILQISATTFLNRWAKWGSGRSRNLVRVAELVGFKSRPVKI